MFSATYDQLPALPYMHTNTIVQDEILVTIKFGETQPKITLAD